MIRFYTCRICGNLIEMIDDSGVNPTCCGEDMAELFPGTTDGAKEKHIPVCCESDKNQDSKDEKRCTKLITVKVGSEPHPMTDNHSIKWIAVVTDKGYYRKKLDSTEDAQVDFCIGKKEKIKAIYAYCNLHGLWVSTMSCESKEEK